MLNKLQKEEPHSRTYLATLLFIVRTFGMNISCYTRLIFRDLQFTMISIHIENISSKNMTLHEFKIMSRIYLSENGLVGTRYHYAAGLGRARINYKRKRPH